jgi:hypothetical protein
MYDIDDEIVLPKGATSLAFLQAVYANPELPLNIRLRAAVSAAPYEQPRLSVAIAVTPNEDFARRLELAVTRSARVIAARAEEPKLVSDLRMPPSQFDRRLRRI